MHPPCAETVQDTLEQMQVHPADQLGLLLGHDMERAVVQDDVVALDLRLVAMVLQQNPSGLRCRSRRTAGSPGPDPGHLLAGQALRGEAHLTPEPRQRRRPGGFRRGRSDATATRPTPRGWSAGRAWPAGPRPDHCARCDARTRRQAGPVRPGGRDGRPRSAAERRARRPRHHD